MTRSTRRAFALVGVLALAAGADADVRVFKLLNHPDAGARPPGYGLRLDGLFAGQPGASGGVTTFSFEESDVFLTITEDVSGIEINIKGEVYGGEDSGTGYGYGEGFYDLDFTWRVGVATTSTGWKVNGNSPASNNGDLAGGFPAIAPINLFDNGANSFFFQQDDDRLDGHPDFFGKGFFVGRGWLTTNANGQPSGGTRDFIFIGYEVPAPGAGALAGLALGASALRRRRR